MDSVPEPIFFGQVIRSAVEVLREVGRVLHMALHPFQVYLWHLFPMLSCQAKKLPGDPKDNFMECLLLEEQT